MTDDASPYTPGWLLQICCNLKQAAQVAGVPFCVVLRTDSTLRGHFPEEPRAAQAELGVFDAWLLVPFFLQGGRYTIDDTHYVADGDTLVPAAGTSGMAPRLSVQLSNFPSFALRMLVGDNTWSRLLVF